MARDEKDTTLAEPLVLSTVGTRGYLKFPKAFTRRFPFVGSLLPNPSARLVTRTGKVQLIYEWTEEELHHAAKATEQLKLKSKLVE